MFVFIEMTDIIRIPSHPVLEVVVSDSRRSSIDSSIDEKLRPQKVYSVPKHSMAKEIKSTSNHMETVQLSNASNKTNHQHFFTSFKPITFLNIYRDQSFYTALKGLGRMSLVKCEDCGVNFICFSEQDIKMEGQRNFKHTFAAYYNTSQM